MAEAESAAMARRFDPVHLGSPRFRTSEHGPFLVTHAWFPPGLGLPPHEHERPVVAVTLEGGWNSVMLGRPYECTAGTLLIEPAGERHSNGFGTRGGRVIVVQPHIPGVDAFQPVARALGQPVAFGSGPAALIARRLRQEIDAPDALSTLAIEALCLELLVVTSRSAAIERRPPAWLGRAIEYLHAHIRQPVTIAAVAGVAGVHPAHLAREFRRHYRTSVASYLRVLRLAWAAERLASSREPIASIAIEAGFADQSHFTRAFRGYSGLTPHAFRGSRSTSLTD